MPSNRRKITALATLSLIVCIIFYITHGASSTHNSQFYTRTVAAIREKQASRSREDIIAEEKQRLDRVDRIAKEHSAALSAASAERTKPADSGSGTSDKQDPIIPDGEYGAAKVADVKAGEKSVAGRKYMKDGKVVTYKPADGDEDDGVAKVGNTGAHSSHEPVPNEDDSKAVEAALNDILRKGPIIIFSKTYCPFSQKAKHILLDLYSIIPPPYVVELNDHKLGDSLQSALQRLTGRRTVPNVMINGKSIGGGDDIEELHENGTLASTISTLGGKRMTKVERLDGEAKKSEMKLKA